MSLNPDRGRAARIVGFALLVLSAATPAVAGACVTINVQFTGLKPSPLLVASLENEAVSIWDPYGVRLEWGDSSGSDGCDRALGSFDVLVERRHVRPDEWSEPLGRTRLVRGPIDHVPVHIDYNAVEDLLGRLTIQETVEAIGRLRLGADDVGRALGRVLAHEIGHVVLDEARHPTRGLMRSSFAPVDLVESQSESYKLSDVEVDRLCERERELMVGVRNPVSGGTTGSTCCLPTESAPGRPPSWTGRPAVASTHRTALFCKTRGEGQVGRGAAHLIARFNGRSGT